MSIYDDFLQGSMYSRPAQMMNTINQYTNANAAVLPTPTTMTPSSTMTKPSSPEFTPYSTGTPTYTDDTTESTRGPNVEGQNANFLSQFFGDLGSLSSEQQNNLLSFIGVSGGDMQAGVAPSEWAQLFGISDDYAERFQGFPDLTNLSSDIENIYSSGAQRGASEVQAAQAANIANRQAFGLVGRPDRMARRNLKATLDSRRDDINQQVDNEYGAILRQIQNTLGQGFTAAGNILVDNPGARIGEGNIKFGETKQTDDGRIVYWIGNEWVDLEEYQNFLNNDRSRDDFG